MKDVLEFRKRRDQQRKRSIERIAKEKVAQGTRRFSLAQIRAPSWTDDSGLSCCSPCLLVRLYHLNPDLIVNILHEKAAFIGRTLAQLVAVLKQGVPNFAQLIADSVASRSIESGDRKIE